MGKRSNFERVEHDFYETPVEAVLPLLPFIVGVSYWEPCAGHGALVRHLASYARCIGHSDREVDARSHQYPVQGDYFITNPPWTRELLHPIIENLSRQKPTWLLFDADWMHTRQSAVLMQCCSTIVSVGRVKWIPGTKMTGKDNVCWYLFNAVSRYASLFYGRSLGRRA